MSTLSGHDLAFLKSVKNSIIGNSSRKTEIAREGTITSIVEQLKFTSDNPLVDCGIEIQTECGHIISSLSFGCPESLKHLIEANTLHVLLHALSNTPNASSNTLVSSLSRALRTFATSIAEIAGPSIWGMHVAPETPDVKAGASTALEDLFKLPSLDIWIPFLRFSSSQVTTSIAWIIASCARNARHRETIAQWLPPSDRAKEIKGKRGWERPDIANSNSPSRGGGWLVRNAIELLNSKDLKVQEAALSALAAVFKDSPATVTLVRKSHAEGDALLNVLGYMRSRNIDVQLAACLCATNMIRASPPPPPGPHGAPPNYDGSPALTVIHILNFVLSADSSSVVAKTKACYILSNLARDEKEIEKIAVDVGSLEKIVTLMTKITPDDQSEWEDDEPENTARLRESVLLATATLTLHWDGVRRDLGSHPFFPSIHICMSHPHAAVRYAACQCARALCRSISVLRTSVVDSGIGITLCNILQNEEEDIRIRNASLKGLCNLFHDFSPMRIEALNRGVITTIVKFVRSDDKASRLDALWSLKNVLFRAGLQEKKAIMEELEWDSLPGLLNDPDEGIQEQAASILRNLSDNDPDLVFEELGTDRLASSLESGILSPNEGVLQQLIGSINNLALCKVEHMNQLTSCSRLLEGVRNCLEHSNVDVRRCATTCILKLARRSPRALQAAGIDATLHRLLISPIQITPFDDKDVQERIRLILAMLEAQSSP